MAWELALKGDLDGKNGKITIADDSTALTDSDGLVQASAVVNPTSMRRRPLSLLWDYINSKIRSTFSIYKTSSSCNLVIGRTIDINSNIYSNTRFLESSCSSSYYVNYDSTIGFGVPPTRYLNTIPQDELSKGVYIAGGGGSSETHGLLITGDSIEMWAPPDKDLIRFWNEDRGYPVASISNDGTYKGCAWMADRNSIGCVSSFSDLMSIINSEISRIKGNNFSPEVRGFTSKNTQISFSRTDFVGNATDGPEGYKTWFVDTKVCRYNNVLYGIQIAWAAVNNSGRTNYKRFYNGSVWSDWSNNDL